MKRAENFCVQPDADMKRAENFHVRPDARMLEPDDASKTPNFLPELFVEPQQDQNRESCPEPGSCPMGSTSISTSVVA